MHGIYIYCIVKKAKMNGFRATGLDGQSITKIDYQDIMALVQPLSPSAIQEEDPNKIIDLALIHHKVVENAWQTFGTLIPLRFGGIIQGEKKTDATDNVSLWLEKIYSHIIRRFEDLKDKAEYGIQIFWPRDGLMNKVVGNNIHIKNMEMKIASASQDTAYIYQDKHRSLLQRYIAKEIVQASRYLLDRVRPYLNDFQIEQITAGESDRRMLLNISCLLNEEEISEIRQALEEIQGEGGFIPFLNGPWPPYSFARLDEKLCPCKVRSIQVKPGGRVSCA